jgi:hypothetical protein
MYRYYKMHIHWRLWKQYLRGIRRTGIVQRSSEDHSSLNILD